MTVMRLRIFKTLWGFKGAYTEAARLAAQEGYDGIEGPVPATREEAEALAGCLADNRLCYIAEVATAGGFVPDRRLSMERHLDDLRDNLRRLAPLDPLFITCLGGCDAWPLPESIAFMGRAAALAGEHGYPISFETHRGRSLFNPWVTRDIVAAIPDLKLTCDFSHWCVVCEGLQESEEAIIEALLPNAYHIHGRVGYDQGPQVPDPRTTCYSGDLHRHQRWWRWIWDEHERQGRAATTVTPEFGPDGYEYRDRESGRALVDVEELNAWMASRLRTAFDHRSMIEVNTNMKQR